MTAQKTEKALPAVRRPREKFEIILDTCSMCDKVTKGIHLLIEHIAHPKTNAVFKDYQIIIPIQLGTEKKQRLFPDFLEAELMTRRPEYLENFYQAHRDHVRIVETDISLAYKLFYAAKAIPTLRQMGTLEPEIMQQAQALAARYDPVLGKHTVFAPDTFDGFCRKVETAYAWHQLHFEATRHKILAANAEKDITRPELIDADIRAQEQPALAAVAKDLFATTTDAERYLLQAMYQERELYKAVAMDRQFANFRHDKGERAIESYLFHNEAESNTGRVTLIVSEDMGARKSIHNLRTQSQNTVFTVSSYGLALALKELKLIGSLTAIIPNAVIQSFRSREEPKRQERIIGTNNSTMQDVLDPVIERQWAHRLVEVVNFGDWLPTSTRENNDHKHLRR